MMNKKWFVLLFLIAMLLLAACAEAPSVNANALLKSENTQQAVTATPTLPVTSPTPTRTVTTSPTAALTLTPISTPTPTLVPTLQSTPTLTPTQVYVPCNQAGFVADVTVPDGASFNPGATFTKTWRLQNLGTCTWTTNYDLVFSSGSLMNGPTLVSLPNNVYPGGTIDLSVNLTAPSSIGTYQGYWMLRDPYGDIFGLGGGASQPF